MSVTLNTDFESATYAKVTWHLLPLLFLCYVASYLDRVNVGFAKLQMLEDLQWSETVYGLGAGIFFLGYFVFEIPSNMILHKVGARIWIGRIMISWGIISGAMIFVDTPTTFYVLRFLLGVAEAGFFPGMILYLTYWYPAVRRGKMTALFMSAVCIAGVIGGPLSGWIMQVMPGFYGLSGWQWMFIIEAAPSVLLGIVVIVYLPDGVADAKWLTEQERQLISKQIASEAENKQSTHFFQAITHPKIWWMVLIYFCFVMGVYGISFWMPTIINAAGASSLLEVGMLTAIPYFVAAIVMVLLGKSADHHRERRWHVAISAVMAGLGLLLSVIYGDHIWIAVLSLTLAASGIFSVVSLFWSLPTAILGGGAAAAGIALINSFGNLAGFLSPYLVGWLKDVTQRTDVGMMMLAGFMVLGAMLTLALSRQEVEG